MFGSGNQEMVTVLEIVIKGITTFIGMVTILRMVTVLGIMNILIMLGAADYTPYGLRNII